MHSKNKLVNITTNACHNTHYFYVVTCSEGHYKFCSERHYVAQQFTTNLLLCTPSSVWIQPDMQTASL